jgi:hypothetical protein
MTTPETGYGPGLHEVTEDDPDSAALNLAEALGAELAVTGEDLAEAMAGRRGQSRPVPPAALRDLRHLSEELAKAERIRARTEAKVIESLGDRLAAGTGVTVHPASIREAAEAVLHARAAVAELEAIFAEQDALEAAPDVEPAEAQREAVEDFAWDAAPARWRTLGYVVVAVGIAVAAIAAEVPIYLAAIVPLLALAIGMRRMQHARSEARADFEAGSHLAGMGAATDELFGRRQVTAPLVGRRRAQEVQMSAATEQLRAAERHWSDLAGPGADPADVDAVLRQRDPQLHRAEVWATQSAAVRTAAAVHRKARARWRVAWAALDRDAPAIGDAPTIIDALASEGDAPTDLRPLVVTGTAASASGSLRQDLERLARWVPVIVVHPDGVS